MIATVTDGQENSSWRTTHEALAELVSARRAQGWLFAYLSADLSAYDHARRLGHDDGSISRFEPTAAGSTAAFASLDRAVASKRRAGRAAVPLPVDDFFEGVKEGEA